MKTFKSCTCYTWKLTKVNTFTLITYVANSRVMDRVKHVFSYHTFSPPKKDNPLVSRYAYFPRQLLMGPTLSNSPSTCGWSLRPSTALLSQHRRFTRETCHRQNSNLREFDWLQLVMTHPPRRGGGGGRGGSPPKARDPVCGQGNRVSGCHDR